MADSRWLEVVSPRVFIDTVSGRRVVVDRTGEVIGSVFAPPGLALDRVEWCIGCGCSDSNPCLDDDGGVCCWLVWDELRRHGVCTECADQRARFDEGDRTFGPLLVAAHYPPLMLGQTEAAPGGGCEQGAGHQLRLIAAGAVAPAPCPSQEKSCGTVCAAGGDDGGRPAVIEDAPASATSPRVRPIGEIGEGRIGVQLVEGGDEYVLGAGAAHRLLDRLEAVLQAEWEQACRAVDPAAMKADRMQEG